MALVAHVTAGHLLHEIPEGHAHDRRLLPGGAFDDALRDPVHVEGREHVGAGAQLLGARLAHDGRPAVRGPHHVEELVDAVVVGDGALVRQHQVGDHPVAGTQGVLDDVLLEGHVVDVLKDAGGHGAALEEDVPRGVPRLGLHLDEVDDPALLLYDVRAHEAVLPAEGCLGDVHVLPPEELGGAPEDGIVVLVLHGGQVGVRTDVVVDAGQVARLVAAVGQGLEEVILVVLVGVTVPVVVVVQRRRAEERLLEGGFGKQFHGLFMCFYQRYS